MCAGACRRAAQVCCCLSCGSDGGGGCAVWHSKHPPALAQARSALILHISSLQTTAERGSSLYTLTAAPTAHQLCRLVLLACRLCDAEEDAEAVHSHCVRARGPRQTV